MSSKIWIVTCSEGNTLFKTSSQDEARLVRDDLASEGHDVGLGSYSVRTATLTPKTDGTNDLALFGELSPFAF